MREAFSSVLLTDLYQLTMLQAYFDQGMQDIAIFEFFVRKLPEQRNFLIAAGIEQVLDYLENLKFTEQEIEFLKQQGHFSTEFLDYLTQFRFYGDVNAMLEGTIFFPNEPVLQVIAPIAQAQLIESRVINLLHLQTLIASKAIRCVLTAPEKLLIDFGMRRAHGAEAALYAARANYIAGFAGTATVLAEYQFGIPSYGTMGHSFIEAHAQEEYAFIAYAISQPNNVILLIDTYDTEEGAQKVAKIAPELQRRGIVIKGVRLDSGDLYQHAVKVRKILDAAHLNHVNIFASGDLDEYKLAELMQKKAPIDGFGVGTLLDTSADAPYLNCAYKLQEYAGIPRRKKSEGKASWPGQKQVYRFYRNNSMHYDLITLVQEPIVGGKPLIHPVMQGGKRLSVPESLSEIRTRVKEEVTTLPPAHKSLDSAKKSYSVKIAPAIRRLAK